MFRKAICLLVPMSIAIEVDVGSRVFAAEIALPFFAAGFLLTQKHWGDTRYLLAIANLGASYLLLQICSDIWNESSFDQYSRGWARILLFLINLASIFIITNHSRNNIILFAIGFSLGRIFITILNLEGDVIPWKIGFAKPVAILLILSLILLTKHTDWKETIIGVMLVALGLFDITMDFRSHGFVLICTAIFIMTPVVLRFCFYKHQSPSIPPAFCIIIASAISIFGTYLFYSYAANVGWLSEAATKKFEAQVESTDVPILVAGRSEVLVYFEAVSDSPLLGHGSWPTDAYYAEKLARERFQHGLSSRQIVPTEDSIPMHSHVFGSWIEAGIVGGIFWAYIISLIVRSILASTLGVSPMRPLYLYATLLLCWDVLFSPFSGFRRLETAFLIVVMLRSLHQRRTTSQVDMSRLVDRRHIRVQRMHRSKV